MGSRRKIADRRNSMAIAVRCNRMGPSLRGDRMLTLYYCSTQKFLIVKGYHTNPTLTSTQAIQAERRNNKQAVFCPMKGMVYRLCRVRLIMPADRGRLPGWHRTKRRTHSVRRSNGFVLQRGVIVKYLCGWKAERSPYPTAMLPMRIQQGLCFKIGAGG